MLKFDESARIIAAESRYVAGGVNSNFRIGMRPGPIVFTHGEGAYLFDADGNRLIDYYCGMGAAVLGHSPRGVIEAVKKQVESGILFAGQTPVEFEAARLLCERIPSAERLRFGSSGSEVAQAAMRLARAATGRRTIVKFEGHYHGWFDNILWSTAPALADAGPDEAPVLVAGSKGQHADDGIALDVLQWNDLAAVEARLAKGDVAAIIMEAAMCNQGAISPREGYLAGVQAACRKHGTILIFDEVITGFRLGQQGAQGRFGITPDLSIFAKALANGFPVAAIVGRGDLLDMFATGGVLHGGTFNSQPVAMAALIATQQALSAEHYEKASVNGVRLREGIKSILAEAGIKAQVTGFELMFHVAFGLDQPAGNYRDLTRANKAGYSLFCHALIKRGVRALERGAWFVSSEHNAGVIDETLEAVRAAALEVAPQIAN
jgi:glutamate-1-semialdehyde 2,1-aminomutase